MKSLTASLWRDYQSCRYIVAEVEFRCSKIEDILQQQILKCFSSSLWQIRKLKFTCWPQTSPIFWVSYVFFLVQKSEASVVFDAFNDELFEKKKTIEATVADPPGLSALKMKSLEVPKDLKGKWFNVMLRCNVCLWRLKPKVALTSPGLQTAHIMICYGAEKSENPLSSAVDDGWNPANQLRLVAYPSIYIVWYVIPVGCLGFLPSTVRLKWNPFEH